MENSTTPPLLKKQSAFVKWAFVIGIAIVINLFLSYLVRAMYHEPMYENFCPQNQVNEPILTKEACVNVGGQWNGNIPAKVEPGQPGYCDPNFTCSQKYQDVLNIYNRNVFVVFVIAGIALMIASVMATAGEAIALGSSLGGVLAFIIGSVRYWSDMQEWLRVIVLGLALAGLLYFAWKKFK